MNAEKERRGKLVFRILFFFVLAAFVAMCAVCAALARLRQGDQAHQAELCLNLEQQRLELEKLEDQLAEREIDLAQAEDTISQLTKNAVLAPDGTAPEYTALYPDLYAEARDGETITADRMVYLTFDDGPSENTDRVLRILDQYGVKATFFVVGKTGEADQQRLKNIVAAGHTLGIHSWSHEYQTIYASVEDYLEDFYQLYQWLYEVTGVYPQIFRFPGGSVNGYNAGNYQEIIAEMTRRGFVYFDWNASVEDATTTPRSPEELTQNAMNALGKNRILLLCHDSKARTTTVEALPAIIEGYAAAGYSFAPLSAQVKPVILPYKRDT